MIRFKQPKLQTMKSGLTSLELTEEGTWESFPAFAEKLTKQIGAKIVEKIDGPDVRIWKISFEGTRLNLVYDDFPNGINIEPSDKNGENKVIELFGLFKSESNNTGL